MVTESARQAALARAAGVKYDSLRAQMATLQKKEHALRQTLDQLISDRNASAQSLCDDDFAPAAIADMRWQQWVEQRRAAINTELAALLAKQIELRIQLKRAFAKKLAAEAVCAQTAKRLSDAKARRATYES